MDRYHSVLDDSLDTTTENSQIPRKKLLKTPLPADVANKQKSSSRTTEFTPGLHTVKKIHENKTPPRARQFQSGERPKSLLNYARDINDNSSGMISLSSLSQGSENNTFQPIQNGIYKKTIVPEDPNNIPLREQARHVDALEKENTDLKVKLQLLSKQFTLIGRGEALKDVTNTIETEKWKTKYEDLMHKYESIQQESDTGELQRIVADLETDLENRDKEISNYADKMESYENQIERLTQELEDLKKRESQEQRSESEPRNPADSAEIEDLEYEKRQLQNQIEKLESEKTVFEEAHDRMTDEIEELKNQLQEKQQSEKQLQLITSQLKDAEDEIEFLKRTARDRSNMSIQSSKTNTSQDFRQNNYILQQEIEQLKSKDDENCREIREKRAEIDSLRQELITTNALVRRLKNDAESAQKQKDYYEEQLKQAQEKVLRFSKDANETILARYDEQEMERLKKQVDALTFESKESKKRWENEKKNLEDQARSFEKLKEAAERQVKTLLSSASSSSHLTEILGTERSKFQQEKDMLQKEISSLRRQLTLLESDKQKQEFKYEQLKKEFDQKAVLQDVANKTANVTEFKIESLKNEQQQQQKEAFKLQSEIDTLNIKIDAMNKLHEVDQDKLNTLEKEYDSAISKAKTLEIELQQSEQTIKRLEIKIEQLESKNIDISQKEHSLDHDLQYDLKKAKTNLKAARVYSKDLESGIEKLRQKLSNLKRENASIKRDNQEIRYQLEQAYTHQTEKTYSQNDISSEAEKHYRDLWNLYGRYVRFNRLYLSRVIEAKKDLQITKSYLMAKNGKFLESNVTTLGLFAQIGLYPDYTKLAMQKRTFLAVAYMVLAAKVFQRRGEDYRRFKQEYTKAEHRGIVWNEAVRFHKSAH